MNRVLELDDDSHLDVGMTLMQVLECVEKMSWPQTQTLSGTGCQAKLLNLTGKVQTLSDPKGTHGCGWPAKSVGNGIG